MKGTLVRSLIALAGLLAISASLSAHHGSRVSYDLTKQVTMKGVVTEYQYQNPHIYIMYDVKDENGAIAHWGVETNSPIVQARWGWDKHTLKPGDEKTIAIVVEGMQDLFSTPMLLQYDPKVISVEDIHDGGFLSGGTQAIAFVQRVDQEHGQAIISATRMPNTPGVSGSGTLMGIQIKALAPGQTKLSIVQVNARDSQQRSIPVVTGEVAIQVQGQ